MANGPPPAPIGTVGVGYAAVNGTDFDVVNEVFAEVNGAFVVVVLGFVVEARLWRSFGAGAPLTTRS